MLKAFAPFGFLLGALVLCSCQTEEASMPENEKVSKRELLRVAEEVSSGRADESELLEHGIKLGEWQEVSKEKLREGLKDDGGSADEEMYVVLFKDDFQYEDASEVEDALVSALSEGGVGQWTGSGELLVDRPFFDIAFLVKHPQKALKIVRSVLREKRVGRSTEIRIGDDVYSVYEARGDSQTDTTDDS